MITSTLQFSVNTYIMQDSLSIELATRNEALIWIETVLFAVINVAAFSGNLLTFYAVYRNQRLRTLSNMFVIALAVSDILMSTCCMPFTVATLFHGRWIFGETFCRFHGFAVFSFATVSIATMGVIAVSRYFCVVKPEKYIVFFTRKRALMYIATVWSVGVVPSLPPLFFKNDGYEFQPGKAVCLYSFKSIAYTAVTECVFIGTPMTIITICYTKVFRTVAKANRVFSRENKLQKLRANVEEAKVTKTLVAVVVCFAFCWLPICVVDTIGAARGEQTLPRQAYLTYSFLCYLSGTINPVIYGAMNQYFRQEYKNILRIIFCFRSENNN